jgi:hypothetical protein
LFAHDLRETLPVFATHALKVGDEAYDHYLRPPRALGFTLCLILSLSSGFLISGASTLYCEYAYSTTLDASQQMPINGYGVRDSANNTLQAGVDYRAANPPKITYNRTSYFVGGAVITAALAAMRLNFVGWPFHPIGFLLAYTYPIQTMWFSIMIGWIAKVMIVKFGGAELYRKARPVFIGLIIGEAGAIAFWLIVSLVLLAAGRPYHAIILLPG